MAFFWPKRKTIEPSETQEDPYDDKDEKEPKRKRKESSSSDSDGDIHKRFGYMPGSDDSSSSSSEEEETPKIEEISDATNDEDDEYEVIFFDKYKQLECARECMLMK